MDTSGSPSLPRAAMPPSSSRAAYRALLDGDRRPPTLARSVSEQPRKSHAKAAAVGAAGRASLPDAPSELHTRVTDDADAALSASLRHTFTIGQLPVLVRQLSQLLGVTSAAEPTFRCHICYDDAPLADAVALTTCRHRFCAGCFKLYLELKIAEGQVYPVCFHPVPTDDDSDDQRACNVPVETSQIEALVDADSLTKLTRFRFDKEHTHVRECPYCAHSQVCSGPQAPQCTCEQCERTFCFLHANAHPNATCADYELRHAESEAVNRAKIQEIAKPCPGCARDVEKNGGCNHMKCIVCNTHFCWLCGEIVEDAMTPAHYDPANGGPCSGRQFEGMEAQPAEWWMRLYVTIAIVVCGPPAFVLTVLAMPFVLCWRRDRPVADRFESVAAAVTIALQVPLAIVFFTIVGIIQNVVIAVLFVFRVLRNAMCRPRTTREAHAAPPNDLEAGVATPGIEAAPR